MKDGDLMYILSKQKVVFLGDSSTSEVFIIQHLEFKWVIS